jgi:hypothetical protein
MSSDSGSDSGSSSSYSSYDEAGISTPTSAYESIGTTGYDEAEQQHHLILLIP